MLDVRALLKVTVETGLTIIPWRDGEPRAFVILAIERMRAWVDAQFAAEEPIWRPGRAAAVNEREENGDG